MDFQANYEGHARRLDTFSQKEIKSNLLILKAKKETTRTRIGKWKINANKQDCKDVVIEIKRPLGLVLESIKNSRGAMVAEILPDGNAARLGTIELGDILSSIEIDGCVMDCTNILFDDILGNLKESPKVALVKLNMSRALGLKFDDSNEVSNYWKEKKQQKQKGLSVLRRTVGVEPKDIMICKNRFIGEGNFGKVFYGEWKGKRIVLKTSKSSVMGADEMLDSELEINEYVHKNAKETCARFYGCCEIDERNSGQIYNGTLSAGLWLMWAQETENTLEDMMSLNDYDALKLLFESSSSYRSASSLTVYKRLITDILQRLSKIHASGVVHRDIKPANIILTENGAKFIDLGAAALCLGERSISYEPGRGPADPRYSKSDDRFLIPNNAITPMNSKDLVQLWSTYMPEKFDMFAVGLIILQILVPCLRNSQAFEKFKDELEGCKFDFIKWRKVKCRFSSEQVKFVDVGNSAGGELISELLTPTRSTRKSAHDILRHRFFYLEL